MDLAPERLPFSAEHAWDPLPEEEWTLAAAQHLLSRAGWSSSAGEVADVHARGLEAALERLFPGAPPEFPRPPEIDRWTESAREASARRRQAAPAERRRLQQAIREEARVATHQLVLQWLQAARDPSRSAFEKWVLFLSDVYVVGTDKVQDAAALFAHHDLLRRHALGSAPDLTKAVSRSPGMILYLDLQTSRREAPNENFARELFELFVLGQGNYSEQDIKEAARAFTGYRQRLGTFVHQPRQADNGSKTVFGREGRWSGDDVIDLAYERPAAATFLPTEMMRVYLDVEPVPEPWIQPLAQAWRESAFDLRTLLHRFFGSRMFFSPEFRGQAIKSPVHFYLGLLQDLDLDVVPVPRLTLIPLRQMGQLPYAAPNVRGWVGGRNWINSATLAARRRMVQLLFAPVDEDRLNADEARAIQHQEARGIRRWSVVDDTFQSFSSLDPAEAADKIVRAFLPESALEEPRQALVDHLGAEYRRGSRARERALRDAIVALLQSPAYQLC